MRKVAVVSAILENPEENQREFNEVVSQFKGLIMGRMGVPVEGGNMAVISITLAGTLDEINNLTGRLGNIQNVTVKAAISKKEIN